MRIKEINWEPPQIPDNLICGDMPGDKVKIVDGHIKKANALFPMLLEMVQQMLVKEKQEKVVISICGGSGVGKTGAASVLSHYFNDIGVGCYLMSGDNYPHRIPKYNDAERLQIFRENAVRGMIQANTLTKERQSLLQELQRKGDDANPKHMERHKWFESYMMNGRKGLEGYLATPREISFEEVNEIIQYFHNGKDEIWFRRMGREEGALWYEKVKLSSINVLMLEWTHGNNDFLQGVDIPVLLNSTPQETLENRRKRNRDSGIDSPFTALVLEIEQELLNRQAHKARLIMANDGKFLSYEQYCRIMEDKE